MQPLNRKQIKAGQQTQSGSRKKTGSIRAVTGESWNNRFIIIAVGVVVAAAVLIAALAFVSRQPGEAVETLGNEHIALVDAEHASYNSNPSTSSV